MTSQHEPTHSELAATEPAQSADQALSAAGPSQSPSSASSADALKAARSPVGVGLSPVVAQVIAVLLIGLGVLAVQDALVRTGLVQPDSWLRASVAAADGIEASNWMIGPFVALILIGLLILPIAFRRRPRKTVSLTASTGVYLRTKDLAKITTTRLEGVDGVVDVHASASRKRIKVTATSLSPADRNSTMESTIRERMVPVLDALERAPRLAIDIRNEKFS